jgi:hypothetical protein
MATSAKVIDVWTESGFAYATVRVSGDGPDASDAEYTARTKLTDDAGQMKPPAVLRAELQAELKRARDGTRSGPAPLPGLISGVINL